MEPIVRMTSMVSISVASTRDFFRLAWIGASRVGNRRVPMMTASAPSDRTARRPLPSDKMCAVDWNNVTFKY